uniref:Uncharacterized protein n=1 Tax=Ciona intestinalis TaxID=7719 RepID=H2XMF8_CIOIN
MKLTYTSKDLMLQKDNGQKLKPTNFMVYINKRLTMHLCEI